MKISPKYKEVLFPILVVSILSIAVYTILRWYADIIYGPIPINQELKDLWLPFILAWFPVLVFLRKRIRILAIAGRRDQGHFLFQILVWCLIFIPTIFSQLYISRSNYKLIEVDNVQQIKQFNKEKYFKIRNFEMNDSTIHYQYNSETYKNDLTLYINVLYPLSVEKDMYYGLEYEKRIKDPNDKAEREKEFRKFYHEISFKNSKLDLFDFQYLERLFHSKKRSFFFDEWEKDKSAIILVPRKEDFEERAGNRFFWIFGSYGIVLFLILFSMLFMKIDEEELAAFKENKPMKTNDFTEFLAFVNPVGKYPSFSFIFLTSVAMLIIILLSTGSVFELTIKNLVDFGGSSGRLFLKGDYWRVITSMFVYNGVFHLVYNLLFLGFISYMWERVLGSRTFFILFIFFGIGANVASIYWHTNMLTGGSFGSISGFAGLIFSFVVMRVFERDAIKSNLLGVILFVIGSVIFYRLGMVNIAILVGGFITGMLIGLFMFIENRKGLTSRIRNRFKQFE